MDYVNVDYLQVEQNTAIVERINGNNISLLSYSKKAHISIDEIKPLIDGLTDKKEIADKIVAYYRAKGYVTVNARINKDSINVIEARPVITGDYAKYLTLSDNDTLTQEDLDYFILKALPVTRLWNQKLDVNISNVNDKNEVNIDLNSYDTSPLPETGFSISATSFGPRYSASNVLTASAYANLGEGVGVEGSTTLGLSDLRKESKGGLYHGFNGGFKYANHLGMFSLRMSDARYEVGGENAYLNYHGVVDKYELEYYTPLRNGFGFKSVLSHNRNRTYFGLLDMNDIQTYNNWINTIEYQKSFNNGVSLSSDVTQEMGLNGKRTFNMYELLGDYKSNYKTTSGNFALNYAFNSGWRVTAKTGGQHSSYGTPSNSQFFIGGVDRGSSFTTGSFSGYNGSYRSVSLYTPDLYGSFQPSITYDDGKVKQATGDYKRLSSMSLGVAFNVVGVAGNVSVSKAIYDPTHKDEKKVNFFIIKSF